MKFIYAILIITLVSCHAERQTLQGHAENRIELKNSIMADDSPLYNLVDSVILIQLETSSESVVYTFLKMDIGREYIYIIDNYEGGSVAIFRKDGKFIKRLEHGNGPGELILPLSLRYDEIRDELLVCQPHALKKYTSNGDFIEEYYHDYTISDIIPFKSGNGYMACQNENHNSSREFSLLWMDSNFNIKKSLILEQQTKPYIISQYMTYATGGQILLSRPLDNNIYEITDSTATIKYHLDLGDLELSLPQNVSDYSYDQLEEFYKDGKFVYFGLFCETTNYEFIKFSEGGITQNVLYRNKRTGEIVSKRSQFSFDNSLIENPSLYYMSHENFFVSAIFYNECLTDFKANPKVLSSEQLEILQNHKEEDNPIIMMHSIKNFE